jgi:leucyl-tRNA---protein transferase
MEPFFDSYKPDRVIPPQGLDRLLELGWYRMHQHIFTCSHVNLGDVYPVHWLRVTLPNVTARQAHSRLRRKNACFTFSITDFDPTTIGDEYKLLHALYRNHIDFDGARSIEDCLLGEDYTGLYVFRTKCISIYWEDKLVAGGYFDVGYRSAASILHFYDPAYSRHSLGKYLMLLTVDYLRQAGYQWYYPGYLVQGMPKMDYKLFIDPAATEFFSIENLSWLKFDAKITVAQPLA